MNDNKDIKQGPYTLKLVDDATYVAHKIDNSPAIIPEHTIYYRVTTTEPKEINYKFYCYAQTGTRNVYYVKQRLTGFFDFDPEMTHDDIFKMIKQRHQNIDFETGIMIPKQVESKLKVETLQQNKIENSSFFLQLRSDPRLQLQCIYLAIAITLMVAAALAIVAVVQPALFPMLIAKAFIALAPWALKLILSLAIGVEVGAGCAAVWAGRNMHSLFKNGQSKSSVDNSIEFINSMRYRDSEILVTNYTI